MAVLLTMVNLSTEMIFNLIMLRINNFHSFLFRLRLHVLEFPKSSDVLLFFYVVLCQTLMSFDVVCLTNYNLLIILALDMLNLLLLSHLLQ